MVSLLSVSFESYNYIAYVRIPLLSISLSSSIPSMRTMIDLGSGRLHRRIESPTSVDCGRQVRVRRSLRSLVECMIPACCASESVWSESESSSSSAVTCTFFGQRKGRVSFCIQEDSKAAPILLLEFSVPTAYLAREMQHGLLRIALESHRRHLWSMYCNGRKVGFAITRHMTPADAALLSLMQSVSVGAGLLPDADLLYLRATFDRVVGSPDSESFHMRNPAGSSAQELTVFLLRS
ncbi:protein MIZU-KUSSEI 1-like [Salvia miltiorrhiza]|uniref:protein MIZU-KUSSEI 1-like n=1 Tax=Salvia miltiorrhiza TaxID=226208 RepID=UPI0025ABC866|nr:protein MIZU-KUSSEI 1-like [Salvia miltiorrhiza]